MPHIKERLIGYIQGLETVDSHEHLRPERERVGRNVDVLTLVSLYAYCDMMSAGLPLEDGAGLWNKNICLDEIIPIEERWERVWPYLRNIKYGSYYRATAIALRDIYGIDDLNEGTYLEATERIKALNKPGLYNQILRDRCGIKTCIVQNAMTEGQDPEDLFTPLLSDTASVQLPNTHIITQLSGMYGVSIEDFDTYLECLGRYMEDHRAWGAAGFKIAAWPFVEPDMAAAREAFKVVAGGGAPEKVLESTALDFVLRKAGEMDWPVAVHCGVWNDYRTVDPKNAIDIVMRYPQTRFDLYHLGMPNARECMFIAKNFANAYLNLCWCYVVSQEISRRCIYEILDTVPVNKVFGFGGDYIWEVENVYGHMVMARETLAEAFSERIERGLLGVEDAEHILKLWLHDNPVGFYGLIV